MIIQAKGLFTKKYINWQTCVKKYKQNVTLKI